MKAAITTQYGAPDVVQIQEVPKPEIKSNEVLINVKAAAVNSGDVRIRALDSGGVPPFVMRLIFGWKRPKSGIQGLMFSGTIKEVGSQVSNWQVGDEIYGDTGMQMGAHAEYIALKPNKKIYLKPENASFEEAAAILFGGTTALYFLEKIGISQMDKPQVMIYGATGSVGTAALEIAKHYGAQVTAVCSRNGEALAQSLGTDEIVIYTEEDYTKVNRQFDIVFDAVGKIKKKEAKSILKPGGKFVTVDSMDVAKVTVAQFAKLKALFEACELHANIDKTYSLEEIAEAHRYVDTGRKKGNVVISMKH